MRAVMGFARSNAGTLFGLNRLATNADSTLLADGPPFHPFYRGCPVPCALCKARAREASRTANWFHLRSLNAHRAEAILRCQRPDFDSHNDPQQDPGKEDEGARVRHAQLDEESKGWDGAGVSVNLCHWTRLDVQHQNSRPNWRASVNSVTSW